MGKTIFARYLRYSACVAAVLAATAFGGTAANAGNSPSAPAGTTKSTAVAYTCFVTFNGGATTVPFGLTFSATAPDSVAPHSLYSASISFPAITPRPDINVAVQDVRAAFAPPAGTRLLAVAQVGGTGTASAQATVGQNTAVLTAHGPFTAGQPFTLPTLRLTLLSGANGSGAVDAAGVTLADPQFSWVRTDPADGTTLRPFACFTTPVPLTTTVVTG